MARQTPLELDDPRRPVPTRPTLIHATGGQAQLEVFDDLAALAERALQLAGDAPGLRLSSAAWPCAYPGLEIFAAFSLYAQDEAGGEDWLASAAVQSTPRERLEAAIAQARGRRQRAAA